MRVAVVCLCLALLLIAELPASSSRKIEDSATDAEDPTPKKEKTDDNGGFFSSLTSLFTSSEEEDDDKEEEERVQNDVPVDNDSDPPPDSNPDKDAEDTVPPLDEDGDEETETNETTKEDRAVSEGEEESGKDKPKKKEKKRRKNKKKSEILDRLEEIEATEDEILEKLDAKSGEPPANKTTADAVVVDRITPMGSGMEPRTVAGKASPSNTSLIAMSDRHFQPGMPDMNDLALYMRTCDNCLVSWDSFQCPMNDMAIELKKWITELEELLSFGCQIEGCEGASKCCHSRDPAFERALGEMTDMARQMYNTFQSACSNCPRDGGWSEWCEWGACSVTCGPGIRTRTRTCNTPSPKGGGRDCPGLALETMPCSGSDCCTNGNWASWSSWGSCSATCGSGMQDRSRTCTNPPPNYCGRTCPGPDKDMRPCDSNIPCCIPQDGNWGPWTPWALCSATCGMGTRDRQRSCSNPPPNRCGRTCPGPSLDTEQCDGGECCVNGNWGPWERWAQCSVSCGTGSRERRRRCDSPRPNFCGRQCPGPELDNEMCNTNVPCLPPCLDGNWGPWQPWSGCSATCGSGIQQRMRRCDNPPPNICGRRCPGTASDTQPCQSNRDCCVPQDGNWSLWSPWTLCSATCGPGTRERQRSCSNPPANRCGRTCPGNSFETDRCDGGQCCTDGNWGQWGSWTQCSQSCGPGSRERSRRCDSPRPNFCGRQCPGPELDQGSCYETPCPIICVPQNGNWSPWGSWSSCSATCGTGMRDRSRTCSNPPPNSCGSSCPGSPLDRDRCDQGPCCVNGNWGPWEPWSTPSVSCGTTIRQRRRRCNNPSPNYCGRRCPGPDQESDPYDTGIPCRPVCIPLDGNWSPWTRWTPCSVTCGTGSRDRTRTCSNPAPNECGRTCPGPSRDMDRCNQGDCCVPQDGNWSPWAPWSSCSVSCGVGSRDRSRTCSNPPPNRCGRPCPGSPFDSDRCNQGDCCVDGNWGQWERWSTPTVTCGTAFRNRRRRCDNPRPNSCGRTCPGRDVERDDYDTGVPCVTCVDGNWAQWSRWGLCSATCGEGMQERERTCSDPPANFCGRQCMGPAKDMRRCNERPCCIPQNGNWGPWTPWSLCSATCGAGSRDRSRSCNNPPPNECGRSCPGLTRDTERCDGGPCCVDGNWGQWERWSTPPVTCGSTTRQRRRRCDSPSPNFCGRTCPGPDRVNEPYDTGVPCQVCIDGNWGLWGAWSSCPVTCGMGVRERRRNCDSPSPNFCGSSCPGSGFETGLQRCGPDPVDGNWEQWGPWESCSRTCGRGDQMRRRRCNRSAGTCGRPCPGSPTDSRSCDQGPCCVDRQWSLWSPWTQCEATCGRGLRRRQRMCRSVGFGQDCGNICPGPSDETEECRGLPSCEPPWGPWSQCSATCAGFGTRERRRSSFTVPGSFSGQQTEVENCQTFSPPCPQPAAWTSWNNWCPCDCRKGVRSRRRTCEEPGSFGATPVDISRCGGAAREEEYCDIRQFCPACITDCAGKVDSDYPSCSSCNDYVRCRGGRKELFSCTANNYEWDAFVKKCREPPSPSCALVECISSCAGIEDGRYPSCFGCDTYVECRGGRDSEQSCPPGQEFNAHSERCGPGQSPTCMRAITRNIDFMVQDAPADQYFPAEDELTPEDRKKLYKELRDKAGVAAKFNRSDEDIFAEEEEKEKKEVEKEKKAKKNAVLIEEEEKASKKKKKSHKKHHKSSAFKCQSDCAGVESGLYQSCRGCGFYLMCTKHGVARELSCPENTFWDDNKKKCRPRSRTCKDHRRANATRP